MADLQTKFLNSFLKRFMRHRIYQGVNFPELRKKIEKGDAAAARMDKGFIREKTLLNEFALDWIKPPNANPEQVFLYFHGGGFCIRTPIIHGQFLARLCKETNSTGVMPDYRLAPEHPFPAALNDCIDSYLWLLENGYHPENIIVGGDSAGASLTLALLLHLRDNNLPLPSCGIMLSPSLDPSFSSPSFKDNLENEAIFTPDALEAFFNAYAPGDIRFDKKLALLEYDFTNLPSLLIQAGGNEILLDDSTQAAEKAKNEGVNVELQVFEDMPHVFQLFAWLPAAKEAQKQIISFILDHIK